MVAVPRAWAFTSKVAVSPALTVSDDCEVRSMTGAPAPALVPMVEPTLTVMLPAVVSEG